MKKIVNSKSMALTLFKAIGSQCGKFIFKDGKLTITDSDHIIEGIFLHMESWVNDTERDMEFSASFKPSQLFKMAKFLYKIPEQPIVIIFEDDSMTVNRLDVTF